MKRKSLLFLLLMAVFAPWAAQAQETLTVYDETTGTLTSLSTIPMYGNYFDEYTKSEFVIPADQLSDMDGGTITSLKFYIQSVGTYGSGWSSNQQVFLKEVSSTSLSAFSGTDDATIVWEGSFTLPSSSDTEFEITFTTPYVYQGGNLLVGIYNITKGGYRNVAWYGQSVNGASGNGTNSSSLSGVSFSQRNFIPKTTFTYEAAASDCPKPTNLVASDVTAHGATLTWECESDNGFRLEWKKASESEWNSLAFEPTAHSYTVGGLDADTEYEARVQSTCGWDEQSGEEIVSGYRETTFTTLVACIAPTALEFALTPGNGTVATLSWTQEGDVNEWDVEYSTDAEFGNFQTVNASGTPTAELQNLTPETTYYARVKTWCGSEGYSQYSNVVTFTPTNAYTITLNDGTNTNSYIPIYGNYVDWGNRSQFILPATELSDLEWASINKITFYATQSSTAFTNDVFSVYMTEVANTTFASNVFEDWDNLSTVYSGSVAIADNKMVITFDTPYTYQGGNLLVGFQQTAYNSTVSCTWYGVTQTENTALYNTANSSHVWNSSVSTAKFLPKVTFDYIPGEAPSCLRPTDLEVSDITTDAAVLTWTAGGSETAWEVEVSSGEQVTTWNANETTFTLPGLNHSTTYSVKVRAICGGEDQSDWSMPVSFTTACGAVVDFPWSYDFENDAAGNFANPCWVNEHIEGNGTKVFQVSTSSLGSNSTHQLQLPDMSNGTLTKLMLPEMTLPGDNYLFSIDVFRNASGNSYTSEGVRVFVSADGEIEGATELAFLYRNFTQTDGNLIPAESASGWYTYELPIPMSGTCYIILRGESQYGSATYMDNFAVMQAPTCMKPTNLAQTHTNHSATLSWTAGNEGQNAWQIAYSTTSFNPNAADFDLTTVEVIDVEDNPYTFDKTLAANTHYYMYVRGYCGDEDYSKWVGIDFTTSQANPSPTITSVDEITPFTAVLRWTAPTNCDNLVSYDIYYSKTSGQPANDSLIQYTGVDAGFTSKILENLTEGYWYVYMRAYHGETDGYSSWTPYYGYGFQVPEACPKPTNLTAGNPTPNSITLTWTEGATWQYGWDVAYSTDPECNPVDSTTSFVNVYGQQGPTITCTVADLQPLTTYYFRVMGHCNSPYGDCDEWTNAVSETTLDGCPVPTDLAVTTASNAATLTWTGFSDEYTVQYRTAGGYDFELTEGFEGGSMPAGWTSEGDGSWTVGTGDYSTGTGANTGSYNARITHANTGNETYLVTPAMDLSNVSQATLSFAYVNRSWAGDTDEFGVYYRVNGGAWNELFNTTTAHSTWTASGDIALTGFAANYQLGFKMVDNYGYGVGLDDVVILAGENHEPGEWQNGGITTTESTILYLSYGTKYDARVKANCNDEYSDIITFTTKVLKLFTTDGAWDLASNWTPAGAPTMDEDAKISAAATINAGVVANADIITIDGGSITIEDGGQLVHNNIGVTATVKKNIVGYTEPNYETNNGYYFISNPLTTSTDPVNAGLIEGTYDLYDWNANDLNGKEWHNFAAGGFNLSIINHPGYLYANMNDVTLTFNGVVCNSTNKITVSTYYNNGAEFGKWNLIGNPFVCNAYLVDNAGNALPYYKMNAEGNGYTAVTNGAIAPVTGIFYETEANARVYFTREAPATGSSSEVIIVIEEGHSPVDNAIIRFGQGQQMSKFSFRENSSKVYIPMDGQNFAIVNAEGTVGEMPVSFEAEKNGTYSLNFTSQEVSFSYLHLIDNMTGTDVDLLETPSYTFNATTSDYASRFRLVFATGSSADGDSFSFINASGNLCIFGIEGKATVQVIDVMGHVLSSETFSGSYEKSINAAPGVYMIRLIQGNDVKVQKVVVK